MKRYKFFEHEPSNCRIQVTKKIPERQNYCTENRQQLISIFLNRNLGYKKLWRINK